MTDPDPRLDRDAVPKPLRLIDPHADRDHVSRAVPIGVSVGTGVVVPELLRVFVLPGLAEMERDPVSVRLIHGVAVLLEEPESVRQLVDVVVAVLEYIAERVTTTDTV